MVMSAVGGKMLLFQAASPSVGVGKIKNRDLPALYGTDRHAYNWTCICMQQSKTFCNFILFASLSHVRQVCVRKLLHVLSRAAKGVV